MKQKKNFLFKSIFVKFVFAFIFVGLFPLLAIGYYIFERLPQDLEQDLISNYNQMLLFSSKNIEMKIGEYNQISQLIYNYQSGKYSSLSQIYIANESQMMEDFLKSILFSDRYVESVFFLDENLNIYSYLTQNSYALNRNFQFSSYPKADKINLNKKELTILPTHEEDYYFRSENHVISFVRNYLEVDRLPKFEKVIGIFFMEVNRDFIKSIFDPISLGQDSQIIIMDKEGYPIYQSSNRVRGISFDEIYRMVSQSEEAIPSGYITDSRGYLFYRSVNNTDWTIVFDIPHSDIYRLVNENKKLGFFLIFFLLLSLLVLAFTFSRKLSQPVKNIIVQMKQVESGDLTSEVTVKTHDEIYLLAQAFNRMVKELNIHINEAYVAQIKQKEAELNAIKTQIRPHYLYNTLEIIRMSALDEDAGNTQKMIFSLSEQLKYLISYSEVYVELDQEIKMIENYFEILYFRYERRIRLEIDIPQELLHYQVLKLMIQPIVENAVMHGLKPKKGRGTVKVSAYLEKEILHIDIIDDGVGMSPQCLKDVLDHMNSDLGQESIGLKNVQNRIKLTYGNDYGLEINSRENKGTLTSLKIPARGGCRI